MPRSPFYLLAEELRARAVETHHLYLLDYEERLEGACNGNTVNPRGIALGVTTAQLLAGPGHHAKRRAYATEEAREYFEAHPPSNLARFETLLAHQVTSHLGLT